MPKITVQVVEFADRAQRAAHVTQLLSDGYAVQHDSEDETVLSGTHPFETEQWMSVFYGLVFFILPAIIYLLWWHSRPVPIVIVRLATSDTP